MSLHADDKGILPFGSRREIVQRYDQLGHWSADGMKTIQCLRECEYLVFDDVNIDFTESLQLSYSYFDYWDVPIPAAAAAGPCG